MANTLTPTQKDYQRLYGLWFGAIFAAVIGLMWTSIFSSYTGGATRLILLAILLLIGIVALVQAITLRSKYPLTKTEKLPYLKSWSFWLKFYAVIIVEFIVIFLLVRLLQMHHVQNGTFPLIVFIVGAHFYPLSYWNGNKLWYATASVLCVSVAILVLTTHASTTTQILGAPSRSVWALVSSGVMVFVMLVTSLLSSWLYKHSAMAKL